MDSSGADPSVGREQPQYVAFGAFRFDRSGLLLSTNGTPLSVQPKALQVLRCLVDRAGEVVLKGDLMDLVWNDASVTENSLVEAVRLLRKALDDDPRSPTYIETAHRRGYRFIAAVTPADGSQPGNGAFTDVDAVEGASGAGHDVKWASLPRKLTWGVAAAAIVAVVFIVWMNPLATETEAGGLPPGAFTISPAAGAEFFTHGSDPLLTADGAQLLYMLHSPPGARGLYADRLDGQPATALELRPHSQIFGSFSSPGGGKIGFFQLGGRLRILTLADGSTKTLCEMCGEPIGYIGFAGGAWAPDGTIVFAHRQLMRLTADGGDAQVPEPIASGVINENGGEYLWPHFLPGGEWVLVTHRTGATIHDASVYLVNINNGDERAVVRNGTSARYVDSGHLVFVRDGDLWAVVFDLDNLTTIGDPARVLQGVATDVTTGEASFTISDTGTLAYLGGPFYSTRSHQLVSSDRQGTKASLFEAREDFRGIRISPKGTRLAVSVYNGPDRDIRIYDLDDEESFVTITRPGSDETRPVWHPSGDRVLFTSTQEGLPPSLVVARTDGGAIDREFPLGMALRSVASNSWSPDGTTVALTVESAGDTGLDVWILDTESGDARPFAQTSPLEYEAAFSPDGRWIAYARGDEIVVASFPDGDETTALAPWGMSLRWTERRGGVSELVYANNDIWRVPVQFGPSLEGGLTIGEPTELPVVSYPGNDFDVSRDGERFVLGNRQFRPIRLPEIVVIPDWVDSLPGLLSAGR